MEQLKTKNKIQIKAHSFQALVDNTSILYRGRVPLIIINQTHNNDTLKIKYSNI